MGLKKYWDDLLKNVINLELILRDKKYRLVDKNDPKFLWA